MNKQTKEALRMAIEWFEDVTKNNEHEVLIACKAALQEDALDRMAENARELGLEWDGEQENCVHIGMGKCNFKGVCKHCKKQEPVAWMNDIAFSQDKELLGTQSRVVPLYTRPTKRLSDDEVFALCPYKSGRQEDNSFCGEEEFYRGFRAAEKAHGIGESGE